MDSGSNKSAGKRCQPLVPCLYSSFSLYRLPFAPFFRNNGKLICPYPFLTMTRLRHTLIAILITLTAWATPGYAQQAVQSRDDISDEELDQRLKFIETRLGGLNPNASYWQYGWTGFYAAAAVAQAALAIDEDDNDDETNYIVGAVKSTGALTQMLLKPLPTVKSFERFGSMPAQTRSERLRKLQQGEALLRENAERAQQRYGWKRHLIGIGANLVGGAVIAAYGDSSDAVTSTVIGIAVSEANIWTEPERAVTDLDDYRRNFSNPHRSSAHNWRLVPTFGGVELRRLRPRS